MTNAEKLLNEALTLPAGERMRLAYALLRSLTQEHSDDTGQVTAAWTAELGHRLQDIREGKVELIDLDEVDAYVGRQIAALRR